MRLIKAAAREDLACKSTSQDSNYLSHKVRVSFAELIYQVICSEPSEPFCGKTTRIINIYKLVTVQIYAR